jgi:hypothetical protein
MKNGLKEFQELYDIACEMGYIALDLAQNLSFKSSMAKLKYARPSEDDVHLAYGLTYSGKKYNFDLMNKIHELAEKLGFNRKDYIDNRGQRIKEGNCQIYIAGIGTIRTELKEILNIKEDKNA